MEITKKKRLQSRQTSSVYDCTVEDVEYIYNKFSLYTERVIDVFYIFNSTVIEWTCFFLQFWAAYIHYSKTGVLIGPGD